MQNIIAEFSKGAENSKPSAKAPLLSDYMDYRLYLKDFYSFKRESTKNQLRPYNYQMFSAAADIKSPNYLKMIIDGKRNLSDEMSFKFAKAMGLDKRSSEELRLLVNFTQATDPADRNMWLKKLSEARVGNQLKAGEIDRKTWEKVPNWVAWVIYAMVDQEAVKWDVVSLKKALRNKASEDEIETALHSLLSSGELVQDATTGMITKARSLMESADDVPVALVRKLQAQLMYLGLESLYQDGPTEREFGTLTLSLTRQEFEEIKFKLRQMRKSLHKDNSIARTKSKGERVYQLNIQFFPITDTQVVQGQAQASSPVTENLHAEEATNTAAVVSADTKKEMVMAEFIGKARALQGIKPADAAAEKDSKSVVGSLLQAASTAASLFDDSQK